MSRLLNMADPEDVSTLHRIQDGHKAGVQDLLNDREAKQALETLLSKGAQPSHVHGAYSALFRSDLSSTHTLEHVHGEVECLDVRCAVCGISGSDLRVKPCRNMTASSTAAARHLLPLFLDGQFENCGDDMAQDAADVGGDAQAIVEN
jgi:hypothetical protein